MMSGPPSPMSDFGFIQLQAAAVYEYEPLPGINYIRRARLHPGSFEEAIVISLDVVPFSEDQRPEYEALSYVWGSPEQPEIVRVDETYGLTISATRNLATALRYLRRTDEPRLLWVDALCINQSDDVEKGPQVKMMGDIYRHATRVVVWLGPEANKSDLIMAKMEYIGSRIQVDLVGKPRFSLAEGATDLGWDPAARGMYLSIEEMDALLHLLLRQWFSRLWIRQEKQLASPAAIITCGHSQVPWPVFLRMFVLILQRRIFAVEKESPVIGPAVLGRANLLEIQLFEMTTSLQGFISVACGELPLGDLRQAFGFADCSDPRDRIYGVLSLLPDHIREGIMPDYNKPFGDVYKDAFLNYTYRACDLSLLGSCELGTGSHMPSWVPDWSRKSKFGNTIYRPLASSQIASWFELYANDVLRVAVVMVGTIQHHNGIQVQWGWDTWELYEELRRLLIHLILPETTIIDDIKIESFARSLVCNRFSEVFEPPDKSYPTIESGKSVVQKMLSDVDQFKPGNFTKDETKLLHMTKDIIGRQIFKTADGQFGVAPEAKSGDQICVLLGCESPMILRETQDGKFLVVGPCLMQKAIDGDSLLGPLPDHMRTLSSQEIPMFIWKDSRTGSLSYVDPRLESLNTDLGYFDPEFRGFRKYTLPPELLREEGVDITYFDLV